MLMGCAWTELRVEGLMDLMVFLGMHSGGKGYIFMRGPNNIIFSAAHATFDESRQTNKKIL